MTLKQALPSVVTSSSILCGFLAITLCANQPGPAEIAQAGVLIFAAFVLDVLDGRVARFLKVQSAFGIELDSLADVSSFGVAPALLAYQWALQPLGFAGKLCAFVFTLCGALRLARFNVAAHQPGSGGGASRYFKGLPIPFAAGTVVSTALGHSLMGAPALGTAGVASVAVLVLMLGCLMVSTLPYRTFKDLKPSPQVWITVGVAALLLAALGFLVSPAVVLPAMCGAYLLTGPIAQLTSFRGKRGASS
jgi:CDP-diacylglycerol--serine O-phosphatidyltransferase